LANLDAAADKAVHDAVDAFMEGRLAPEFAGEIVFETKHSRYRLRHGVVYAAPSDGLIGAELVGWLMETARRCTVESAWQPGSRAVLVDRKRGRNIIVTSSTRLLHLEEAMQLAPADVRDEIDTEPERRSRGLPVIPHQPIPTPPPPYAPPPAYAPPPYAPPPYAPPPYAPPPYAPPGYAQQPARAPILAATPPPPRVAAAPFPHIPQAPIPMAPQRRGGALHLPPRPIAPRAVPAPSHPQPRPLAGPAPPPPGLDPPIHYPPAPPAPAAPPEETPWEVTSAELELAGDEAEATLPRQSPREVPPAAESGAGAPIPLVRPRDTPRGR
jgi:hypothetical protein